MTNLTAKQRRFVEEYLVDLNATQAAIRAGYSKKTARVVGAENLTKPAIESALQSAIERLSERTEIRADQVLADIRELADMCLGRKPMATLLKGKDEEGNPIAEPIEVLIVDPPGANKALELLGRHLKLFTDKVEHSGQVVVRRSFRGGGKTG